ncbi:hypothetical protein ABBQ32_010712 [Trebouxia sp. C0010 RCD-2024]
MCAGRSFQTSLKSNAERVLVDHVTLVLYNCRSLEKCIERTRICLNPQDHVDQSRPSQSEQDHVQAVLQEADDPSYWVRASQDGNRESHYRGVALGCTLVADLFTSISESGEGTTSKLLQIIRAFRHQVDSALPDMYAWFDETSLHVTIRALMG